MRTADLPELLRGMGVGSAWYAVDVPREDSWCIQDMGSWWAVFYLERGTWGDIAKFGSEDQACRYLLGRFTELAAAGTPGLGRDRKTLAERIEQMGVGTAFYRVGGEKEGAWSLIETGNAVQVFKTEGGRRVDLREWEPEELDSAESYLVGQLMTMKWHHTEAGGDPTDLMRD